MALHGDIGQAFEQLKRWMAENRQPADRLGMTYPEYKVIVERMNGDAVADGLLRPLYDAGVWPYAAYKQIQKQHSCNKPI